MEKVWGVVCVYFTPSTLSPVWILSQVDQFLGGEAVSPSHDEVVLKIEGLVLVVRELRDNMLGGCIPPLQPILPRLQASCTSAGRPARAC